jgi:hypothetical protein
MTRRGVCHPPFESWEGRPASDSRALTSGLSIRCSPLNCLISLANARLSESRQKAFLALPGEL